MLVNRRTALVEKFRYLINGEPNSLTLNTHLNTRCPIRAFINNYLTLWLFPFHITSQSSFIYVILPTAGGIY